MPIQESSHQLKLDAAEITSAGQMIWLASEQRAPDGLRGAGLRLPRRPTRATSC